MRDLDRSMHRSLYVYVAHSSFIEGSHTTKNTTSGGLQRSQTKNIWLCEPTLLISKVGGLIEPISEIIDNFNKQHKVLSDYPFRPTRILSDITGCLTSFCLTSPTAYVDRQG